jgi:hypothetical protein
MEFPTTDKQIKMWCFAYADEQRDFSDTMDIDGADRVERAKRLYDFICSYQPSVQFEDMRLMEKLVLAYIPKCSYPFDAAEDLFTQITGRKYIPSSSDCRDARTSQHEQMD